MYLFSPILTRLYGPDAIGVLGVFISIVAILTPIAHLAYGYAIVLPPRDGDSIRLLRISIILGLFGSLLTLLTVILFGEQITQLLNLDINYQLFYLVPPVLFFSVVVLVFDQWFIRIKSFKINSGLAIAESVISNFGNVILGFFAPGYLSLVVVNLVKNAFHATASFLVSRKTINNRESENAEGIRIWDAETKNVLREYQDFPVYRTPQILFNSLSKNLPVVMLTILSGPFSAGLYTLCNRVLKLPSIILADAVGNVLNQRLAEASKNGEPLQPLIINSTILLAFVGIIPFAVIFIFGPPLFALIFGEEWLMAGEYARWLAVFMFFSFICVPSIKAIPLLFLQKQFLYFEVISLFLKTVGLSVGMVVWNNDVLGVAIFSMIGAFMNIVLIIYIIFISKGRNRFINNMR